MFTRRSKRHGYRSDDSFITRIRVPLMYCSTILFVSTAIIVPPTSYYKQNNILQIDAPVIENTKISLLIP